MTTAALTNTGGQPPKPKPKATRLRNDSNSGWLRSVSMVHPRLPTTPGELEDHPVVDTPYMDDVAKNGISPWGHNVQ
jgi:hypothetical protein